MPKAEWLDRPDGEGWFWMWHPSGKKTVACVENYIAAIGCMTIYMVGYRQPFSHRDLDTPAFAGAKWKRLPEPMDPKWRRE